MFKRRKNRMVKSQSDYLVNEESEPPKDVQIRKEHAHKFASAQGVNLKTREKKGIIQSIGRKVRLSMSKERLKEDAGVTGDISMADLVRLHGGDEAYINKPANLGATTDSIVIQKQTNVVEAKKVITRSQSETPSNKATKTTSPFKVDFNVYDCDALDKLLDEYDSEISQKKSLSAPSSTTPSPILENNNQINSTNININNNMNTMNTMNVNNNINVVNNNSVHTPIRILQEERFDRQPSDEIPSFIKNLKEEFKLNSPSQSPNSSFSNLDIENDFPHDNELIVSFSDDYNHSQVNQIPIANGNNYNHMNGNSDIDKLLSEISTGNEEDDQRLLHFIKSNENLREVDIDDLLTF